VQVYTAQSPAFLNSVTEPLAVTSDLPSASLPTGISLNNGNGRPWIANAPNGAGGNGTITVLDPQGFPLAGAPDPVAGGVFAGNETNRAGATHGLTSAALGTAILTKSPDLTGRAVFAAVEADGSVVQVNVMKGVDALAPARTVTPLALIDRATAESADPHVVAREGMAFNWVPTRNLFVADPQANRLLVLDLTDDGTRFAATPREIRRSEFDVPIDLAPTTREVAAGSFASNTTLGGGSDLYVLNRGNNTIVRMTIGGDVQAVRRIDADIDGWRANGIAVGSDGQVIYVTGTTPGLVQPDASGRGIRTAFLVPHTRYSDHGLLASRTGTAREGSDVENDCRTAGCDGSASRAGVDPAAGRRSRSSQGGALRARAREPGCTGNRARGSGSRRARRGLSAAPPVRHRSR
jgi:hypothetical protein